MACRINLPLRWQPDSPIFSFISCRQNPPVSPCALNLRPPSSVAKNISYSGSRGRRFLTVRCRMATENRLASEERMLPTVSGEIQSPMGVASVEFVDPREPIAVVPILRAGLALSEHAASILPATKTYHLGISRDEDTLQPTVYLNKLPENFSEASRVFVVDPMLATGGTIVAALDLLKERGVENRQIKVISAVAAPPALQKLSEKFPGLHVYAGIIDPTVNDKGFIIPGLGDAGDRSFGT
ncbi:uracil phosphoribosyltransferase isoform X2 [Malania oleifera]|uniref:uracil phosphoribosyltransferase isoform X2 n=1 Tax=Malania oleifera TaxID=397392 RepID=UPI0025AE840C|nr:uracil phosphoribosyltransferase isoform X2 [Malania oleifera]